MRQILVRCTALLLSSAFVVGCGGGFHLDPVTPQGGPSSVLGRMPVSMVTVSVDPTMADDQRRVLEKFKAPAEIERVLGLSLGATGTPGGAVVMVNLTSLRYSRWGPTRMHGTTTVTGPDGLVLKSFGTEALSTRSRALERVGQDFVRRIGDNI